MDEESIGADQARRLREGLDGAGLGVGVLWMRYFRLGGDVSQLEVEAYLHHALTLPALQRNFLAQALDELADGHRIPPVPFSWDYPTAPDVSGDGTAPSSQATVGIPPVPADPPRRPDRCAEDPDDQDP